MENKQNSSRRRQRQAARVARLRDYYAQRDGEANDASKDEKPPQLKQATQEEIPGDNVVGLRTDNEVEIKSECPQIAFEALEACSTTLSNAAQEHTSSKQVKSDLSVLARGESASDISNNVRDSVSEPPLAEQQNISEFVTPDQDGDTSLAFPNNSATASSETLISQSDGFTFGTVVAPLYHQAFQRVSAENPVNTGDFSPPSEPRQTCAIVPINTGSSMGEVQEHLNNSQGSNDECLTAKVISPTCEEKETLNIIPKCVGTVQNPTEVEKKSDQHSTNKSLGEQCPLGDNMSSENVHSQTEGQEDNMVFEAPTHQSPEQNSSLISAKVEETLAKSESKKGLKDFQIISDNAVKDADTLANGFQENNCECTEVSNKNENRKTDKSLMEGKLLQVLDELNTNQTDSKGCLISLVSLCEPERTNLTLLDGSLETQEKTNMEYGDNFGSGNIKVECEVVQSLINEVQSNNHCHADISGRPNDQNILGEKGQCKMDSCFLKQDEEFLSTDTDEAKNWEMMVEEEEKTVLSNEDEIQLLKLKIEDDKTKGKEEKVPELRVDIVETCGCKEKELKQVSVLNTDGIEGTELFKMDGQEETKMVSTEKARAQDEAEKMEIDVKRDNLAQQHEENRDQKNPDFKVLIPLSEAEEIVITDADSDMARQNREDELRPFQVGSDFTQNRNDDDLSALVSRALKNDPSKRQYTNIQTKTLLSDKEEVQINKDDQSTKDTIDPTSTRGISNSADESDSTSAESDSDEELQLYVHCLRIPGAPAQVCNHKIRDVGFKARNRPSKSRDKVPPTSMPSISEALDEEKQHTGPLETYVEVKTSTEGRSTILESINRTEWKGNYLFSCSNFSKKLMYTSLMVVFTVVAYHYDFLACFLLYLISVIWLCCQGAKQPLKDK